MRWPSHELIARLSLGFSFMVLLNIIVAGVFVQFVYYHAHNTVLSPDDYTFDLATKEDYAKLSDPAVREFAYADGRYMVKAAAWDELHMARYYVPSVDGRFYVQVTAKGTAPFVRHWTDSMALVLMCAIPALVFNFWNYRNLMRLSRPAAAPSEPDQGTVAR